MSMFATSVRRADICVQVGDVNWRELRTRSRNGVTDGLQYRHGEREHMTSRSHVRSREMCACCFRALHRRAIRGTLPLRPPPKPHLGPPSPGRLNIQVSWLQKPGQRNRGAPHGQNRPRPRDHHPQFPSLNGRAQRLDGRPDRSELFRHFSLE
jgi:hypothetical protein